MSDWQASNSSGTHSFSDDEFRNAFEHLKAQQTEYARTYREALDNLMGIHGTPPKQRAAPKWNSLDDMMASLNKQKIVQMPKPIDPAARRAEIETELDIIRGRVPTPKGYKIDPLRAKKLMIERKQLPK